MQCLSCGTNNPPTSPFCGGCGQKMEAGKATESTQNQPAPSFDDLPPLIRQSLEMAQDADDIDDEPEGIPEPSRTQDTFANLRQAANHMSEQARPLVQRATEAANAALSPPPAASSSPVQPAPAYAAAPPVQAAQASTSMPRMPVANHNVQYEYTMWQVPPNIEVRGRARGQEAAAYLQHICSQYATQDWEFYRVDTIGVLHSPGCLAALLGQRSVAVDYYVITFRRPL